MQKLERTGKVSALVRALEYEDPVTDRDGRIADLGTQVRADAAGALARTDDPLAVEGLLRALADPEEAVRVAAIRGLRERGGPAALEALVGVATGWTDPERAQAREEATETLVQIGDPHVPGRVADELLARATDLGDTDCDVAARLARAGGEACLRATIDRLLAHLREASAPARARRLLVALAPESVDALIGALDDERSRRDAALALGGAQDARAIERLSSIMLSDGDSGVRRAAAWAIGEVRHPLGVEALLLATRDSDFHVRSEAIDSFEKLGNAGVALAVGALMQPALEESTRQAIATLAESREDDVIAEHGEEPGSPREQEPAAEQATVEAPADEAPADEAPADEAPADEAPDDEAPADEEPAAEASPHDNGAGPSPPPVDAARAPERGAAQQGRSAPILRRLIDRYTRN